MPDLSKPNNALVIASLALALLGSLGSVYLSMGLGLKACPLCYYQRTFVFAALGVLLIGVVYQAYEHVCLPALALPLALGGLGVAAFHVSMELRGKMECPIGVTTVLSAPKESFTILLLLSGTLLAGALMSDKPAGGWGGVALAVVLAALFTVGCLMAAGPAPAADYDKPIDMCRPLRRPS